MRAPKAVSEVASGVFLLTLRGANTYFVVARDGASWVLVDAAWAKHDDLIAGSADALFGGGRRPEAIVLTHVHGDHCGSAAALARRWEVPVYAHELEVELARGDIFENRPFMDPIGKVILPLMRLLPRATVRRWTTSDLKHVVEPLPEADLPGLPEWQIVPTPGHSPGHVALFRPDDRVLLAGDAVLTAAWGGLRPSITGVFGPPRVSTWDRVLARRSVAALASLRPSVLATGHGHPMSDAEGIARGFAALLGDSPDVTAPAG